jgi:hypothetical protein
LSDDCVVELELVAILSLAIFLKFNGSVLILADHAVTAVWKLAAVPSVVLVALEYTDQPVGNPEPIELKS